MPDEETYRQKPAAQRLAEYEAGKNHPPVLRSHDYVEGTTQRKTAVDENYEKSPDKSGYGYGY
jgi:hypothetical protein